MIEYGCECNFGIQGVEKLPSHDHNDQRNYESTLLLNLDRLEDILELSKTHWTLRDSVHIWINWKELARV